MASTTQHLQIRVEDADLADGTQQDKLTLLVGGVHVVSVTKPAATSDAEHAAAVRSLFFAALHQDVVTTVHDATSSQEWTLRASALSSNPQQ